MADNKQESLYLVGTASFAAEIGSMVLFVRDTAKAVVQEKFHGRELLRHCGLLARACMFPVIAVVVPACMGMAVQGLALLGLFGAEPLLSSMIVAAVLRELSPLLVSVAVIAQAGSSMAAELGAMRVREEIDAVEAMGVNPLGYLIVPRILASMMIPPFLLIIGAFIGVFGAYIIAVVIEEHSHGYFMENMWLFLSYKDLWASFTKMAVFGFFISVISCHKGFFVTGGAAGVGRAVNSSNVWCVLAVIFFNYIITSLFYGGAAG